ncbi:phosphopantetheine-binding protein [Rhizobium sp. L1K21]|uniref:phosphopantetheine-binding protein n=1 Tax=Rhizobium sp. L1K21 TaxID=2954933 RepID=UPI002093A03D|nr:phosphopantetheine-binding protein [Rhizobium sp. L1K21]MCO6187566.1 phosphopantetheine-binding protein [Rhizobium sp. L1K21]
MEIIEEIRGHLATVLDDVMSELDADQNLIEVGLHSLAIMQLIKPLSELAGRRIDYADLAAHPTLRSWGALVCRQKAASNETA